MKITVAHDVVSIAFKLSDVTSDDDVITSTGTRMRPAYLFLRAERISGDPTSWNFTWKLHGHVVIGGHVVSQIDVFGEDLLIAPEWATIELIHFRESVQRGRLW